MTKRFGALTAVNIVVVRFLMDDKLKTAEDIRQYAGLATLAVVPTEETEEMSIKKHSKKKRGRKT